MVSSPGYVDVIALESIFQGERTTSPCFRNTRLTEDRLTAILSRRNK